MDKNKALILAGLKKYVLPEIKKSGYSGTFPHFRKKDGNSANFLSFQFNKYGGSFIVEAGWSNSLEKDLPAWSKKIPFGKLNYGHININKRKRLQPKNTGPDFWFDYSKFTEQSQFDNLALLIVKLLPKNEKL
jgi:hypothetical protein